MQLQLNELSYALNTLYLLLSGILIVWMGAGFTMLEAGLVRSKNTLEIILKNIILYAIASIMFMLIGYDLTFNSAEGNLVPAVDQLLSLMFINKDNDPGLNGIPKSAHFFFEMMFVAITLSIISGAVAERMKLWAFLLFTVVMTSLIYPVQAYWNWGEGFLQAMGYNDLAGSGTVHLAGATAALAGVLLLGPRKGKYGLKGNIINAMMPGANLPLATLGMLMLWLGWFGFNGRMVIASAVDANAVAITFVNTNMAAAGGLLAMAIISRLLFGKVDLTLVLNGTLAGLVAITAAPDTPSPLVATIIGIVASVLVLFAILTFEKLKLDDPVGTISVHGVAGIWGLLAVPLTDPRASFLNQAIGLMVIFSWVFTTSFVTWYIIKITLGLRVAEEEEYVGLDLTECGMEAYPEFVNKR